MKLSKTFKWIVVGLMTMGMAFAIATQKGDYSYLYLYPIFITIGISLGAVTERIARKKDISS